MDLHPSPKPRSAVPSVSNVMGTTLATQTAGNCIQNEKDNVERKATGKKVMGPAASFFTVKATLPRLPVRRAAITARWTVRKCNQRAAEGSGRGR